LPNQTARKPLSEQDSKKLLLAMQELKARGIELPPEVQKLFDTEKALRWPVDKRGYFVKKDGKFYEPSESQEKFIKSTARYVLFYGSRGSGKSGAGAQKAIRKIMMGESGAVINPDFENFRFSTWPELRQWIPWSMVIGFQRHRARDSWEPHQPFALSFINGARMYCKGLKNPDSARGPNINWLWYDEAGRDETGMGWRIATASVRVGKDPQAWATATPRPTEHWMYKFFIKQEIPDEAKRAFEELGQEGKILVEAFHGTIEDNKTHLDPAFYASILTSYPSGYMRAQEVDGEFANEGGKIGDRAWFKDRVIATLPTNIIKKIRSWDTAGSEKKVAKDDPDASVGSLLSKFIPADNPDWLALHRSLIPEGQEKLPHFVLENQVYGFWEWEKLLAVIKNTAVYDGPYVEVFVDQDPGGAGKNQVAAIAAAFKDPRNPELHAHKVSEVDVRKVGDRVLAANTHWFGIAAEGRMWLYRGGWNEVFLGQVDGFTQVAHEGGVTSVTSGMSVLNPARKWAKMPFVMI
jgi:phage terminase large subunit-like protein